MTSSSSRLGPYTLIRELGAGGMGEVHLARDSRLGRDVALKILPDALAADRDRRSRLIREARAAAALNHPNIATIYDIGEADGRDFVAFERIEGQTLQQLLQARSLGVDEVLAIAIPLADALAYAHEQGVIHRDVKPGNVMLTERGAPKLLDFGLAKFTETEGAGGSVDLTVSGAIVGTPHAMSPEQAQGRPVDARSDVFAFGSLVYELLAGRPAFRGENVMDIVASVLRDQPQPLSEVRGDVPQALVAVIDKALRKDPAERYASMRELLADLERVAGPRHAAAPSSARNSLFALATVAVSALLAWAGWRAFGDESADEGRASFAGARFGVIGFEGVGEEARQFVRLLVPLLTTDLAESGELDVISNARVREVERRIAGVGGFDAALAREVADAAGAEVMLVGDVAQRPEGLQVFGEIVDVRSGRSLGAARATSPSTDDLFAIASALCDEVRAQLGLGGRKGLNQAYDPAAFLTSSTAAWNRFVAGRVALHEGAFDRAKQYFESALREDETFALAAFYLSVALDWSGARGGAELEALVRGQPHLDRLPPRWRATYEAAIASSREDFDRAFDLLTRLAAEPDVLPDALNLLGELHEHDARHWSPAAARAVFERALAIDPTFSVVVFHLVDTLLLQADDAALAALVHSLREHDPESARALTAEATSLLWHRKWRELEPLAEEIERRDLFMSWWFVGNVAKNRGRLDEALAAFDAGVAKEETFRLSWALQSRALAHVEAGRFRDAIDDLDVAWTPMEEEHYRDVRRAGVTFLIDEACLRDLLGDASGAIEAARRAVTVVPHEARGHYWLVRLLLKHGEPEEVEAAVATLEDVRRNSRNVAFPFWASMVNAERALHANELVAARVALEDAANRPREERDVPVERWLAARLAEAEGDPRRAVEEYAKVAPTYAWYVQSHALLTIEAEVRRQCLLQDLGDPAFDRGVFESRVERWGDTGLALVDELRERLGR